MPNGARDEEVSVQYAPSDPDEPVSTIVEAVASVKGVDTTALRPLQRTVDTDALHSLISHTESRMHRSSVDSEDFRVSFDYEGCEVSITRNRVRVRDGPNSD
jgi:hypothetical protein